ncbi:hypothetical protein Fcan01_01260 [Folsomia candida]|uniref:Uncharacterized protein n=1 Tax=Folsomia candida TaxID=158441 RepID=A0A226F1R9_FOLCA|nr:hypothetical protein Fcan01_01260 [Folsomia candida]
MLSVEFSVHRLPVTHVISNTYTSTRTLETNSLREFHPSKKKNAYKSCVISVLLQIERKDGHLSFVCHEPRSDAPDEGILGTSDNSGTFSGSAIEKDDEEREMSSGLQ